MYLVSKGNISSSFGFYGLKGAQLSGWSEKIKDRYRFRTSSYNDTLKDFLQEIHWIWKTSFRIKLVPQ